jgi:hypothetical protein
MDRHPSQTPSTLPPGNDPWIGRRIVTLVPDYNDVESRGVVDVPIGWTATVAHIVFFDDGEPMYAVVWDDDYTAPGLPGNMGWTVWSASELRDQATRTDGAAQ